MRRSNMLRSDTCLRCETPFTTHATSQRYCTPACREKHRSMRRSVADKEIVDTVCKQCGKSAMVFRGSKKYCSTYCRNKARDLRHKAMPHSYLNRRSFGLFVLGFMERRAPDQLEKLRSVYEKQKESENADRKNRAALGDNG